MANLIFTKSTDQVPGGPAVDSKTLLTAKMLEADGSLPYDAVKAFAASQGINPTQMKNLLKNIDGFQWTTFNTDSVTPGKDGTITSFNLKTSGATGGNEA